MYDSLAVLALNVRTAEMVQDAALFSALKRAQALSARLDALLANRPATRPEWIASRPVWQQRKAA